MIWSSSEGADGASVVRVWNTETGSLIGSYEGLGFGEKSHISAIEYHPKDYLIAMCTVGNRQPVLLFSWDGESDSAVASAAEGLSSPAIVDSRRPSSQRSSDYLYADVLKSNPKLVASPTAVSQDDLQGDAPAYFEASNVSKETSPRRAGESFCFTAWLDYKTAKFPKRI